MPTKRFHILKRPAGKTFEVIDPDNPPLTEEMLGPPRFRRGRGPQKSQAELLRTLRLDPEVLEYFRAKGAAVPTPVNGPPRKVVKKKAGGRAARHR